MQVYCKNALKNKNVLDIYSEILKREGMLWQNLGNC